VAKEKGARERETCQRWVQCQWRKIIRCERYAVRFT